MSRYIFVVDEISKNILGTSNNRCKSEGMEILCKSINYNL